MKYILLNVTKPILFTISSHSSSLMGVHVLSKESRLKHILYYENITPCANKIICRKSSTVKNIQ